MSRLPIPGSDSGNWGTILNDFLAVEHNDDGTLKSDGSLSDKVSASRNISTGTGLTGGGNLTGDLSLSVLDNTSTQKIEVAKTGTLTGTRKRLNFVEGSNVTITATDNAGNDRVDVTITAASTGGGGTGAVTTDTIASLRALGVGSRSGVIQVLGYHTVQDDGGGLFYWDAANTTDDDNGLTILPTGLVGAGRWVRIWDAAHGMSVKWFGAVGDAHVRHETTGIMYSNNAMTTVATDDTQAFKDCVDAMWRNNHSAYDASAPSTITYGYNARNTHMVIPGGGYYLASPRRVYDRARVVFGGARTGWNTVGAGMVNTTLYIKDDAPGTDDFFISDRNAGPFFVFTDLTIYGCTGNEKIYDYFSTGSSQDLRFTRVGFINFAVGVRCTGTGNADKIVFDQILVSTGTDDARFFLVEGNSQSVAHTFIGGNISINGSAHFIHLEAGGPISIHGGSWIVKDTAVMVYMSGTGATLGGQLEPNVTMYGVKTECHNSARMIDINIGKVIFFGSALFTFPANAGNAKYIIRNRGAISWQDCKVDGKLAAVISDGATWAAGDKPTFMFRDCILPLDYISNGVDTYSDQGLTTLFAGNNEAGRPRIFADGCNDQTLLNLNITYAANGAPYANLGFSSRGVTRRSVIGAHLPRADAGLPNTSAGSFHRIVIPKNCVVVGVCISKIGAAQAGSGNTQSWTVKDLDGALYATLTLTSAGEILTERVTVTKLCVTDNERTFELRAAPTNTNHYATGFFEIEYI